MASTTERLVKSYVNTYNAERPVQEKLLMREHFEKGVSNGHVGELVALETKERISTTEILAKADKYARGLISLGLKPGEDRLAVVGCCSVEACSVFVACVTLGIGYAHPYNYKPRQQSLQTVISLMSPKVLVVGEGAGGAVLPVVTDLFEDGSKPGERLCEELPSVEHIFYDNTYQDRSPTQSYLSPLSKLIQLGETVTDTQLQQYKNLVQPDFPMFHLFTSGSTGRPKCVVHTQNGLANEIFVVQVDVGTVIGMSIDVDEMLSYALLCLLLAGRIRKLIQAHDLVDDRDAAVVVLELVQCIYEEKVEHLFLPGTLTQAIRTHIVDNKMPHPQIQSVQHGGQIVSRGFKEDNARFLGGVGYTCYGISEMYCVGWTPVGGAESDLDDRLAGNFYTKFNTELRIVDSENQVVDIGKEGEIQVKTYSLFKEYRTNPEKTEEAFTEDGFFKTGDIGCMTPNGSFIVKGRLADAIRFKVYTDVIYPGPIEEKLSVHPKIANISVVSAQTNDTIGDELTFCIMLVDKTDPITEKEITELCGRDETILPARILYMEKFPTTANARKVSKKLLRDQVRKMVEENPNVGITKHFRELIHDQLLYY